MSKILKTAIIVDLFGTSMSTPEEEVQNLVETYEKNFGISLKVHQPVWPSEIEPSTKLVLFDYGGMMPGNSLMQDQSRELITWADNNPNSLVVVVSAFTYNNAIEEELNENGLVFNNIICQDWLSHDFEASFNEWLTQDSCGGQR